MWNLYVWEDTDTKTSKNYIESGLAFGIVPHNFLEDCEDTNQAKKVVRGLVEKSRWYRGSKLKTKFRYENRDEFDLDGFLYEITDSDFNKKNGEVRLCSVNLLHPTFFYLSENR